MPSAAMRISPAAAAPAAISIGARAERATVPRHRPQVQPTMHSTRAYTPTTPLPGGARSRASPATKPVIAPGTGPPASPRAVTITSTRSGTAPPGRCRPLR